MIICPNCNHPNPDAAVQCEACYTPLPNTTTCPSCGANVQADAAFCGQCGYNLVSTPIEVPPLVTPDPLEISTQSPCSVPPTLVSTAPDPGPPVKVLKTQLQQVVGRLFHLQGNQEVELPQNLSVIHIGKPNDRIPPDIDVAGFSNSEIVSRIHADIRVEGDAYYIEDVGSSNGTYINNLPLLPGNRHRLRPGDRISLGKGDLVTFLFQLS
ncbi:phosphopeptide-binding protein [Cylindrospermopsis raciborskii CENA303]|uniref:Phosphopeptide-binding protein n=1 Tax=Cylindrospermopsis raciborskii CENA303 TaxID=1170769 RepID=A0A1X4GJZ6_9CYAN|nr:FHA domain-containing protein [Cylindrospermopsis raciborskii]OSO97327.1 phosphopeptide-binding protein [Cylindrospermopsis raciborskii CENA303]